MGYISPSDPIVRGARAALGPGFHTDEASSALDTLRDHLVRADWDRLAEVSGGADAEVFENPGDDEDDENEETVAPQAELFPLAFLTTGMWGPEPAHNLRPLEEAMGRRALQLVRENPYDPRSHERFFDRMRRLAGELEAFERRVVQRYDDKRREVNKKVRPWQFAAGTMRRAVAYVLSQEGAAVPTILGPTPLGLPKGAWHALAAGGNSKLPFVSYSELPMATCPGAGACAVRYDYFEDIRKPAGPTYKTVGGKRVRVPSAKKRRRGWCYSFKAWRNGPPFARQFLSTLANAADREFAIILGGGAGLHPDDYAGRVRAALKGMEHPKGRVWPQFVKAEALDITRGKRAPQRRPAAKKRGPRPVVGPGANVFLRLFVDGDINHEDTIVAWMQAVAQMGPGSRDIEQNYGFIEVYGYTKCWQQFVNVDGYLGGRWPVNYRVNLSSGSVYHGPAVYAKVRERMQSLPVSRGYFEAIPLRTYIGALAAQTELMRDGPLVAAVPMPPPDERTPFAFDPERVRAFLRLNAVRTLPELQSLLPGVPTPLDGDGRPKKLTETQVRSLGYDYYLSSLATDPVFGAVVVRELEKDKQISPVFLDGQAIDRLTDAQVARLRRVLFEGPAKDEDITAKLLHDKALALALHETLWSYGLGGSCPLICGNCSDNPSDAKLGVHRCASKTTFAGKTIHIGLH